MKTVMTWLVALVAVAALAAGSAYLAFEASPAPIFVGDDRIEYVERVVEVAPTYETEVVIYISKTGDIQEERQPDSWYRITIRYDDSPYYGETMMLLPIESPEGDSGWLQLGIEVPAGRVSIEVESLVPASPESEDEF